MTSSSFLMLKLAPRRPVCKIRTIIRFLPRSWGQSDVTVIISVCTVPRPASGSEWKFGEAAGGTRRGERWWSRQLKTSDR
jgi:hypothetical protein